MQIAHHTRHAVIPMILAGAFAAALAAGAMSPSPAVAAPDPPDWQKTYNRMIAEIMSPYCHGLTLDDCPTQGASELRLEIRGWLIQGRSEDDILDELELRFGPSILGAPRMRGIGVIAWLVPPLALFVGTIGVLVFLRRHGPSGNTDPDAS